MLVSGSNKRTSLHNYFNNHRIKTPLVETAHSHKCFARIKHTSLPHPALNLHRKKAMWCRFPELSLTSCGKIARNGWEVFVMEEDLGGQFNGKEATVNRVLDGSTYPG